MSYAPVRVSPIPRFARLFGALLPRCLLAAFSITALAFAWGDHADAATGQENGVLRATLGNGLRVVIVRNTLAPVVSVVVNYVPVIDFSV